MNGDADIKTLMQLRGIRITANRLLVARALASAGRPVSMSELEIGIGSIDKSGIFRALTLFRERHLVHAIDDGGDGVRYELCMSTDEAHDEDIHVHFFCEECHRTVCLESIPVPEVSLPQGYEAVSANYLVKGLCPRCSARLRTARDY